MKIFIFAVVLNNKVGMFTDMTNRVSISIQNLNGPGEPIFALFIVSNGDICKEKFAI